MSATALAERLVRTLRNLENPEVFVREFEQALHACSDVDTELPGVIDFLAETAVLAARLEFSEQAVQLLRRAIAAATQQRGSADPTTLQMQLLLATLHQQAADHDAVYELLRTWPESEVTPETVDLRVRGELLLASAQWAQSHPESAQSHITRAKQRVTEFSASIEPAVAFDTLFMSASLRSAAQEHQGALEEFEAAHSIASSCVPPRPELITKSLSALVRQYLALGALADARRINDKALEMLQREPGHSPLLAELFANRAALHSLEGEHGAAQEASREAVKAAAETWPADHPQHALLLCRLAATQLAGDSAVRKATFDILHRALGIQSELLGNDHIDVALTLLLLGQAHLRCGRHGEALPALARSVQIFKQRQIGQHADFVGALCAWGIALKRAGIPDKAIQALAEARALVVATQLDVHYTPALRNTLEAAIESAQLEIFDSEAE